VLFNFLSNAGFKVLFAEDGQSALEKAHYANPDLILLDILMPGMDGFETCRRLKQQGTTAAIPVIFLTALTETTDKVKGLALGAVDFITKPLQYEEVLARVKTHLRLQTLAQQLQPKICS
jgi:DNA-binding response OmpR family regulator